MSDQCIFCEIIARRAPAVNLLDHTEAWPLGPVVSFDPLAPQVPGHRLFVPKVHLNDATHDPLITSQVFRVAAQYVSRLGPANIITSVGAEATQTVFHLHVHVLPRGGQDGLRPSWPWVRGPEPTEPSCECGKNACPGPAVS